MILVKSFIYLFNATTNEGQLSKGWLPPTVITVHSDGERDTCDGCSPMSPTPIVLKTSKGALRNKVVGHLESSKLTTREQHGFWHKRSCLASSGILNEVTGMVNTEGIGQNSAVRTSRRHSIP